MARPEQFVRPFDDVEAVDRRYDILAKIAERQAVAGVAGSAAVSGAQNEAQQTYTSNEGVQ